MRVDQFLKRSCLVKHRSFAKLACDRGRVFVDGVKAKPSKELRVGSRVVLSLTDGDLEIEVVAIPKGNVSKARAQELYRVLRDETKSLQGF